MDHTRLEQQVAFLLEADRLKSVLRATTLADGSRAENSAEHSWHLTLFALLLSEHAPQSIDKFRVVQMLILHDLVEIDAGDAPIFDDHDAAVLAAKEQAAADRLFGLLPQDQGNELRDIWEEFEAAQSPEARFAKSLDRFQPPLLNLASGGGSWIDFNVDEATVRARVGTKIDRGAPKLWAWLGPKISTFFASINEPK